MSAQSYVSEDYRDLANNRAMLADIRGRLDSEGVVELTDFLTLDAHALLKRQILELESKATSSSAGSNQKYALKGEHLKETVVGELARSNYMVGVVNGILEPWIADDPIRAEEIVPGINIMRGPGDVTAYHFDGTYLNMILPVVVPKLTGERRGQLTAYPNIRSFKRTIWAKVVSALARIRVFRRVFRKLEVDYHERGAYLFYGYRTLHGVESPAEPGLRAVTNMTVGGKRF